MHNWYEIGKMELGKKYYITIEKDIEVVVQCCIDVNNTYIIYDNNEPQCIDIMTLSKLIKKVEGLVE